MATSLVANVKDILTFKLKVRHDSYSDQYSRIFMVKILFVSTLFIGLNWYSDKITCIVPDSVHMSSDFVSEACWIQGFYIYENIAAERNTVAYYGIPTNLDYDGIYDNGKLCITDTPRHSIDDPACKSLPKTFYIQYQFMPFFVATLTVIYYTPYIIFKISNTDMISLKLCIKTYEAEEILNAFFVHTSSNVGRLRVRVIVNMLIKCLYVLANVLGYFLMDRVFHGKFLHYGINWANWSSLSNELAYDYMGKRDGPKPGNVVMPTFGICEIHEGARDMRATITNKHKFICEYSQNILYHYSLVVLWFAFTLGVLASMLGLLIHLAEYLYIKSKFWKQLGNDRKLTGWLTFREYEYLKFIRRKNMVLYGEVLNMLHEIKDASKQNGSKAVFQRSLEKQTKLQNAYV